MYEAWRECHNRCIASAPLTLRDPTNSNCTLLYSIIGNDCRSRSNIRCGGGGCGSDISGGGCGSRSGDARTGSATGWSDKSGSDIASGVSGDVENATGSGDSSNDRFRFWHAMPTEWVLLLSRV